MRTSTKFIALAATSAIALSTVAFGAEGGVPEALRRIDATLNAVIATLNQLSIKVGQLATANDNLQNQFAASVTCPAALQGRPRFVDNGDGTICDSATGLMWEKKIDCAAGGQGNPHCVYSTYRWSVSGSTQPNGTLYSDFLANLNDMTISRQPCFAGHCDWRIPKLAELRSIRIAEGTPPCAPLHGACFDPIFAPTSHDFYFTSDSGGPQMQLVWVVNFWNDFQPFPIADTSSLAFPARAVRGGR